MSIKVIGWEDSTIEIKVLQELIHFQSHENNILLPSSSGETGLNLLSCDERKEISDITFVGRNGRELSAIELKVGLIQEISNSNSRQRADFLEGKLSWQKTLKIFTRIKQRCQKKTAKYWSQHQQDLIQGLHSFDYWLPLCKEFRQELKKKIDQHRLASSKESSIKLIDDVTKEVFSTKKLLMMPGMKYRISQGLSHPVCYRWMTSHRQQFWFYNSKESAFPTPEAKMFYSLMYRGEWGDNLPPYLKINSNAIDPHKIRYIQINFLSYLAKSRRYFDLISCGCLTDNFNKDELRLFLKLLNLRCSTDGRIILRRMTSDLELDPIVNELFVILMLERDYTDHTYLYKEIIVARPRMIR